jgi:hypothetical protein
MIDPESEVDWDRVRELGANFDDEHLDGMTVSRSDFYKGLHYLDFQNFDELPETFIRIMTEYADRCGVVLDLSGDFLEEMPAVDSVISYGMANINRETYRLGLKFYEIGGRCVLVFFVFGEEGVRPFSSICPHP